MNLIVAVREPPTMSLLSSRLYPQRGGQEASHGYTDLPTKIPIKALILNKYPPHHTGLAWWVMARSPYEWVSPQIPLDNPLRTHQLIFISRY
jgi:hypothetical protein